MPKQESNTHARRSRNRFASEASEDAPPHSIEDEAGALGCVLQDGNIALPVLLEAKCSPRWFYDLRKQAIWKAALAMHRAGKPVNLYALHIEHREYLSQNGCTLEFLTEVESCAPSAHNAAYYIEPLRKFAVRRDKIEVADRLKASAFSGNGEAEAYDDIESILRFARNGEGCDDLPAIEAKPLSELVRHTDDDPNELLRHRYLCRGAGLLLVGPTGIGKSSLAMQMKILWAIGRPAFGIQPVKPLKSLLIQAENDEGDLAEMRDGAFAGLKLTEAEKRLAMQNVIVVREDVRTGASFFARTVRPLLEKHRPDLVWIDPALAYLGGEFSSQKDVGGFLRNMLNPLLREFACGGVGVHHANKPPTGREKPDWSAGDFAYLGGGSSEWGNWPRAVLAVRSLGSDSVFELRAGKRGSRLRWTELDGETKAFAKLIAHAHEPGVICWREVENSERPEPAKAKRTPTKEDILAHVPAGGPISKDALRAKANDAGIALNKINPLIEELLEEKALYEWHQKRPGTNPKKLFGRTPQPQEELPE